MKALILAAGMGNRLQAASKQRPKSLLRFEQKTLLQRHIENLAALNVKNISIVTGYEAEQITDHLHTLDIELDSINILTNPEYQLGSVISFHTGKDLATDGDDILLMDADVLYANEILSRLVNSQHANVFLLDQDFEPGEEPVKLCIKNGQIIEFRKQIDKNLAFDFQGESVGFFKFSAAMYQQLQQAAKAYIDAGKTDEPYEEVIRGSLLQSPEQFQFEEITGLPWIEIDFPEDVERAKNDILPQI